MPGAWLRELLPVAWERPAGWFEGQQTAGSNTLKNRWLGRGCGSCCQLPAKGLRKGLKRWRASKRQGRTPLALLKTDGCVAARVVASCLGKACGRVWSVWGRANGRLEHPEKQMWLRELLPVAWERPAEGFEAFEGEQTAWSNALKKQMAGACGCESCCPLPWPAELGCHCCRGKRRKSQVPHLRWSQAPPRPQRRPGSADIAENQSWQFLRGYCWLYVMQ